MDIVTYAALQNKIKQSIGEINIPENVSEFNNDADYQSFQQVLALLQGGIVRSLSVNSTHAQCPSAKCVYDRMGGLQFEVSTTAPVYSDNQIITFLVEDD